jgi:hypothetical protein
MAIEINMQNIKVGGNARVFNNASIKGNTDAKIDLSNAKIDGTAVLLENFKMDSFFEELHQKAGSMDQSSAEYQSIRQILQVPEKDKKTIAQMVTKHIASFSQGVLENVLAGYINKYL